MNTLSTIRVMTVAVAMVSLQAHAADFTFSDHISYNTDVVQVSFTVNADASPVQLWSDSWRGGLNFDPTLTLWVKAGNGYSRVGENDDDDSIHSGQGFYDAGLALPALAAGQYLVTLGAAPNYANGVALADGFVLDGSAPILVTQWNQPSYDINANDQKGTQWRLHLTGVESAAVVPEPSSFLMLLAGMGVLMAARRRA